MENSHPLRQNRNSLFREALDSAVTRKPISSSRPKASIPEDDGVSRVSTQGSLRGAPSEVSPVESERFEESLPGPQIPRVLQAPEAPESPPALQTALESPQAQEHSRQKGLLQACHAVPVDSTSFLYLNSPPSRGVSSSFFSQHRNHGWFWELVSCLLSFVSLAAIIIILKHYDGQPAQKWPHPITLNSFLAVFTTLAKAGLVFPVTEALGQLKWVWFGEAERPLIDFQTFDEASRGPIGGIRLLGMLKGRHLPCVGAAISILGLAVSPITQQMVSYPIRTVATNFGSGDAASAPRSDFFMGSVLMSGSNGVTDLPMKQAIQNALYNPVNESIPDVEPTCSTGDCIWPHFSSLAVCAQVANISNRLSSFHVSAAVRAPIGYKVTLPNGAYLEAGQHVMNITTLPSIVGGWQRSQSNATLAFFNESSISDTAISNFFVIYRKTTNSTTVDDFGAMEVLLHWCVNTYDTKVVAGDAVTSITSNVTRVVTNDGTILLSNNTTELKDTSDPSNYTETGSLVLRPMNGNVGNNFTVESKAKLALDMYLLSVFGGTYGKGFGRSYSSDAAMMISSALFDQPSQAHATGQTAEDIRLHCMEIAAQNMATSMTNNIRQRKYWGEPAKGTSSQPHSDQLQSFIEVQWGWLAFLIVLLVSSFGFLLATIFKSRKLKVDVLRSSAVATLCGLSVESKEYMGLVELRGQTWEKAEGLKVRLNRTPNGWSLDMNSELRET